MCVNNENFSLHYRNTKNCLYYLIACVDCVRKNFSSFCHLSVLRCSLNNSKSYTLSQQGVQYFRFTKSKITDKADFKIPVSLPTSRTLSYERQAFAVVSYTVSRSNKRGLYLRMTAIRRYICFRFLHFLSWEQYFDSTKFVRSVSTTAHKLKKRTHRTCSASFQYFCRTGGTCALCNAAHFFICLFPH